jgi:starch phosphorylase
VPQLSTADGWWAEGYNGANGWTINQALPGQDEDALDADQLFAILENDVVPRFYRRDERGIPCDWVHVMKQAMMASGRQFTARRMLQDYVRDYYMPSVRGDGTADDPPMT